MVRSVVVISADTCVQSTDCIGQLHTRHDSLVPDMEAAAIAHIATIHDVPFLTIKNVSRKKFSSPRTSRTVWSGFAPTNTESVPPCW
ncbi:MAG: hypothetical protein M3365_04110 [Gemmatimonadota bacterium]|nr:hypothetical protein [Gemmatimonadota bacterium]